MTIVFYHCFASPPCAAVLLAAKSIGVELNIKVIDYDAGEHLKPDFLKVCISLLIQIKNSFN